MENFYWYIYLRTIFGTDFQNICKASDDSIDYEYQNFLFFLTKTWLFE